MLGISHYLACRSSLAKHFIVCYLWPLTVGSYLDLHSHNENQLVMIEFKLSRSVMTESNLSRSECVVLQIPQYINVVCIQCHTTDLSNLSQPQQKGEEEEEEDEEEEKVTDTTDV